MTRNSLRWLAAILTTAIIAAGIGALDRLPSEVRAQIDADRAVLASAQKQLQTTQGEVERLVKAEPELFLGLPASRMWPDRFAEASFVLRSAGRDLDELGRLREKGHNRDRAEAEQLLAHERRLRSRALEQAAAVSLEASRWAERKRHLPEEIRAMEASYRAVHDFDLAPLTAAVRRAAADWPEKQADLERRLAEVTGIVSRSEAAWRSTEASRRGEAGAAGSGALLAASDGLQAGAAELPRKADELTALAGQLYTSWDKVLVDMEARGQGPPRAYNQKIRTVTTKLTDVAAKAGTTASEEKWIAVSRAEYDARRDHLGMTVEHKAAGRYDAEAERVAQPAGFAYVAPPEQGRNQYGYWERSDGQSFWVFYGQYALLRDLLFNRSYRPMERGEWEGYRNYRDRGQTYYGQERRAEPPRYGTNGTETQKRYSGSTYARGGGFRESPYAAKSGGYRASPYASPAARDRTADAGKQFGRGKELHATPPPQPRSYRPAPRPSLSRPSPGGGRHFRGRGR